jgi:hypothetical protein
MTITIEQLRRMTRNPKLFAAMAEDNQIDTQKLRSFKNLSKKEIDELTVNAEYWMKNYATFDMYYSPQLEYEVNPIHIHGIRGLYLVKIIEEEGLFFNTKKEAIAYANEAIKSFFIDLD